MACLACCSNEFFAWVTDSRQSGITDHGNAVAVAEFAQELRNAAMCVVLMKAAAARFRSQGCEQLAAVACVLASDGVHSNQQGPGSR